MQELLPLIGLFANEIKQFNQTQTLILQELKEIKKLLGSNPQKNHAINHPQ